MKHRFITVPEPVIHPLVRDAEERLADIEQEKRPRLPGAFAFGDFVTFLLNNDDRFTLKSGNGWRAAVRLDAALVDTAPWQVCSVRQDDWDLLRVVAEEPTCGMPALRLTGTDGTEQRVPYGRVLLRHLDAIAKAPEKRPVQKAAEPSTEAETTDAEAAA